MRLIFKLFSLFTKLELFFIKGKFKSYGKKVSFGYLPSIENPQYIEIGNDVIIGNNATLYAIDHDLVSKTNPNLVIGNNIYIGHNVSIHCMNKVVLEDNVVLSDHIYISDVSHGMELDEVDSIMKQPWYSPGPVVIGKGTFLGYGVKILPNVILGNNCIIAAGSVVTKSFDSYTVLGGVPAKSIKKYCFETQTWKKTDDLGRFLVEI